MISKPSFFEGEAALINGLFAEGMQRFHLRKEGAERKDYEQLLGGIDPEYLERIALHQFHELAPDFGIRRLHFPEWKRRQSTATDLARLSGYTLSTSIHNLNQLTDLDNFNYSFYGPVFQSISKKDYPSVVPEGFRLPGSGRTRLIALGGVDPDKTALVKQMGFEGLAVLGSLWNVPEQALKNFIKIKEKCQTDLL